jgi:hypothetical protein
MYQAARQQHALMDQGLLKDRDYDTEDAPSQSETDEEVNTVRHGRPQRHGQPTRVRDLSHVDLR